ncbi:hypothetical protein MsAg5_17330 [Methanosarcinaceae archaeon Ag5]|uniref:5-bromo-4-chloroindolyl phosphate hydrolysis protein n=1 Tax=Methanolapillus africanus TaxID=3028297 RepID=A0AAE4ML09_9EURY|nr:hypothetical protein [Methanosarcinaceae archaeon Ag5]
MDTSTNRLFKIINIVLVLVIVFAMIFEYFDAITYDMNLIFAAVLAIATIVSIQISMKNAREIFDLQNMDFVIKKIIFIRDELKEFYYPLYDTLIETEAVVSEIMTAGYQESQRQSLDDSRKNLSHIKSIRYFSRSVDRDKISDIYSIFNFIVYDNYMKASRDPIFRMDLEKQIKEDFEDARSKYAIIEDFMNDERQGNDISEFFDSQVHYFKFKIFMLENDLDNLTNVETENKKQKNKKKI